ncbi:glycosyltransferase involved in cell wall biosynthesis [Oikeobacillus pervagus]|uniref:Glycosyltransferase involved in cell wall biosynthesis n=1 Tax=Oikeobacillus pervagus TaxID=1325931 RepID=A0AAJ1WLN7_9BACI|nr:glycosyltransferase [Oikeobacillus pervagus]MDQ0216406.1 glycosyltransferase involved in cell wall biosynthesis [Oikeobacillus pervagus]
MNEQNLPLVSVLIPTFNRAHYFRLALESVLKQTYKNIEIIVTDNSTNDETENLIQSYLQTYPSIKYYRNPENIGPVLNFIKAYELSSGDYVNLLMDDDLFQPNKIEKMMSYFINDHHKEITLVTSHRSFIDQDGALLPDTMYNKKRFENVMVLDGNRAGDLIISEFNWIGVPSTTLFRREALSSEIAYGFFSGRMYRCGVDCAAWLTLLQKGKMVYIPEILSYLRIHSGGAGQNPNMLMHGTMDWMHMLFHSRKNGFLISDDEFSKAINTVESHLKNMKEFPLTNSQNQEITYYEHCLNILKKNRDV